MQKEKSEDEIAQDIGFDMMMRRRDFITEDGKLNCEVFIQCVATNGGLHSVDGLAVLIAFYCGFAVSTGLFADRLMNGN